MWLSTIRGTDRASHREARPGDRPAYSGPIPSTYVMDVDGVRTRLSHARLVLGPLERTVRKFLASRPAVVAFAAIDVDLYTSAVHALKVLEPTLTFSCRGSPAISMTSGRT